jgi:hypothetical protein
VQSLPGRRVPALHRFLVVRRVHGRQLLRKRRECRHELRGRHLLGRRGVGVHELPSRALPAKPWLRRLPRVPRRSVRARHEVVGLFKLPRRLLLPERRFGRGLPVRLGHLLRLGSHCLHHLRRRPLPATNRRQQLRELPHRLVLLLRSTPEGCARSRIHRVVNWLTMS